jgi:hypothetical protein
VKHSLKVWVKKAGKECQQIKSKRLMKRFLGFWDFCFIIDFKLFSLSCFENYGLEGRAGICYPK